MKLTVIAASAVAALALGTQTASAQPVLVQPAYSPGVTIGGTIYGRGGISIGGSYSTAPAPVVVAQPYAGPVYVPPPVVVVRPPLVTVAPYGYGYGYRPYYAPYGYHHHGRW